jgi:hypothetical protein
MSYRHIQVAEKTYDYVIGKSFTKIKGVGLFPNSEIGNPVVYFPNAGYYDNPQDKSFKVIDNEFVVTPATVRAVILGESTPVKYHHRKNEPSIYLMRDPFEGEIYQKSIYRYADFDDYQALMDEI